MNVPSYQMHNMLNVYSKQLRHNMSAAAKTGPSTKPLEDQVHLTPEVKRQATIEKVSRDILNKISRYGTRHNSRLGVSERAGVSSNESPPSMAVENRRFVFNAIDKINNKSTNTLSVENSKFLIQRLDQLAKEAVDKKS